MKAMYADTGFLILGALFCRRRNARGTEISTPAHTQTQLWILPPMHVPRQLGNETSGMRTRVDTRTDTHRHTQGLAQDWTANVRGGRGRGRGREGEIQPAHCN